MKKIIVFGSDSRSSLWRCITVTLFLSVFFGKAFSQSDTTKRLNQITVNATSIPPMQAIVPLQTITQIDFIKYNALNVADAIRNFPGVIIKDYGGIGGLKTVSVRGLGANHTAVLYDGVQINDAENGQVDLGKVNVSNIRQITIYNAQPANILQTARAFAAASVLAIETVKPNLTIDKPYQITAGLKAGSFGLYNPYLLWQQRLSNSWALVINSYTQNANGRYNYLVNDGNIITERKRSGSEVAVQQIDGALLWDTGNNKFNLHINYFNSDRGVPGPVIQYAVPASGQKLYNRDLFMQSSYQHSWKDGFELLLSAKFSQNQLFYFDPNFPNSVGALSQHFGQREYYQSAALVYSIKPNWTMSYSTDIALNNLNADRPNFRYPTRLTLLNVLATNLTLGNWTLQGNILNANINETVKLGSATPRRNILAPTIIAAVKPFKDKSLQLRAYYKYSFRVPTFNDQYYNFISNPNLQPEFAIQYNVGVSYAKSLSGLLSYITLNADAYYNYVTNKLVFIPTLYNGYTQNAGKVDIKGLDLGLKTEADPGANYKVNMSVNYSFQQPLYVDDQVSDYLNRLPYIPLHTLAVNVGVSKNNLGVYYNQILSSSRYYENNPGAAYLMPAYDVGDASLVYKIVKNARQLTLSTGINNVFDKRYEVVRSYPMPGRSYRFSIQITI